MSVVSVFDLVQRRLAGLIGFAVVLGGSPVARSETPPPTVVREVVEQIHGVEVRDPYRWLENEIDPEVQTWLGSQRAYCGARLNGFAAREVLARRFRELYGVDRVYAPSVYGKRYIFGRHEGGKNHVAYYVREGSHAAPPRLILDPNTWSPDGTVALDWMHAAPDGSLIAYGQSAGGTEKSTLRILDVASGKQLPDQIPHTRYCDLVWEPDLKGFLYTRYPEPGSVPPGDENYHRKLYHHRLGDDWHNDGLVLGDLVQKEELLAVSDTSDHRFIMLSRSVDWAKNDLYLRPAGSDGPFVAVAVGRDGLTGADACGEHLYIRTNVGAPRYRIVKAPIATPAPEHWQDVIPEQKGVIQSFAVIGGRLLVSVSEDVHSRMLVYDLNGKPVEEVKLPALGTLLDAGAGSDEGQVFTGEPAGDEAFFSFESFAHPPANYRYQISTGQVEKLEQMEIDLELDRYTTEQVWFNSKDGTRVPMFVTHLTGLDRDGDNPTVLYGYGGFDISLAPRFDRRIIPWLDAGGVYVVANIRGGGEFGREWHQSARLGNRQKAFDDFIAAAEKLIELRYTNRQRLAIYGGSNGGLLVGACLTQRPDLYQAVVCAVPLLDMVRYHGFQIARLWIPEFGSAEDAEQFRWLYAYSPYHRVKKGVDYPATLLLTAEGDSRVQTMHAYKMAAALQAATAGDRPILLRVEEKAGHGAGKPLDLRIAEQVDIWTFLMWQLGLIDGQP